MKIPIAFADIKVGDRIQATYDYGADQTVRTGTVRRIRDNWVSTEWQSLVAAPSAAVATFVLLERPATAPLRMGTVVAMGDDPYLRIQTHEGYMRLADEGWSHHRDLTYLAERVESGKATIEWQP